MDFYSELAELCKQGWTAVCDKRWSDASSIADNILALNESSIGSGSRDRGHAYEAYSIKGLVFLEQNGVGPRVTELLVQVGKNLKSRPATRTFGPNFVFAQAMLDWKQDDAVIDFLEQACLPVCLLRQNEIREWIDAIRNGEHVDFGDTPNLVSWMFR